MSLVKKENIVIVHEYTKRDGSTGKEYKTIGEIVTMQGNDGQYQFGKIWGPHGFTEFKIYDQKDQAKQVQQAKTHAIMTQQQSQNSAIPIKDDFDDDIPFL